MGFGVSGASAVIFLGLFIAAGTLYTTTSNTAEVVSDAQHEDRERLLDRRNTAINVTDAVYDTSDTLNVTIENTGTHTLSVNATTVVADNEYGVVTNASVEGDPMTDLWEPGTTLRLTVTNIDTVPSRVKIVTETGVADAAPVRETN